MSLHRTEALVPYRACLLPVHQGSVRAGTCNVKTKRLRWEPHPSVQGVAPSAKCSVKHDKDYVFNSIVTSLMEHLVVFPEEASANKATVKLEILCNVQLTGSVPIRRSPYLSLYLEIKSPITRSSRSRSSGRSRQPPQLQQQMPAGGTTWVDPTPYNGPQLPTVPSPAQTRQGSY
ncbi:uncharacterized protein SPPG_08959 [Spizellomyces punctatus DAOM BR117]|uniref:Uncharacterized protein n=1 Tax=Spizellomyces punctatus (strain DAOM BR117) TaxID=645134 RepID=A0A0L0HNR7_SPIPD|nr:uncharacterized protein SPPG_08959 [Spizellomyces punctatus DAOM BR117]KND02698.1 hypothetical protein SPPG_08959 [Spizellomyces punctatus DAOM BR117]|eukprot:XP_016610737.1 hypothetical protein SPPG_08959 [Spizellomyces punctatus DAOM BR117]